MNYAKCSTPVVSQNRRNFKKSEEILDWKFGLVDFIVRIPRQQILSQKKPRSCPTKINSSSKDEVLNRGTTLPILKNRFLSL
jgi:hypothetical protein